MAIGNLGLWADALVTLMSVVGRRILWKRVWNVSV